MEKVALTSRDNNFSAIKFVAAIMVLAGHMGILAGGSAPYFLGQGIQGIGVKVLFLVGGYLICKSWLSDPNVLSYFIKRFFRVMPPLIVCILITTFIIGPIVTVLPMKEYFSFPGILGYLKNIFLYVTYILPGVFGDLPYPNAVNGSLWTMPVEVSLYVIVPILLTLVGLKKNTKTSKMMFGIITVLVCGTTLFLNVFYPTFRVVIYGMDMRSYLNLLPYYLIGVLFTFPEVKKYCNLQVSVFLILLYSCFQFGSAATAEFFLYLTLPYFVFSFSFETPPFFANTFKRCEMSYSIYLYGFVIQQTTVWFFQKYPIIQMTYTRYFLISTFLIFIVAYLSYRFIEIPTIKLIKHLTQKIKVKEAT